MVPKMDGVLFSGQSIYKWMRTGGCSISGNHHICMYIYIYPSGKYIQKPMENHHFLMDKSTINHYIYIHVCGIAPLAASYVWHIWYHSHHRPAPFILTTSWQVLLHHTDEAIESYLLHLQEKHPKLDVESLMREKTQLNDEKSNDGGFSWIINRSLDCLKCGKRFPID